MYKLIFEHTNKKHFGAKILIYQGEHDYLLVAKERDIGVFLIDLSISKCYPIDSLIEQEHIDFSAAPIPERIEAFFDVSNRGHSTVPSWMEDILSAAIKSRRKESCLHTYCQQEWQLFQQSIWYQRIRELALPLHLTVDCAYGRAADGKMKCYPKYAYVIYFILSAVLFLFSLVPVLITSNDTVVIKLVWSLSMLVVSVIMLLGAMHNMQHYDFEQGHIVVRSIFGIMVRIKTEDACAYIETLPTYQSWTGTVSMQWICIYDRSMPRNIFTKFQHGCSNSRKKKRIQIIYSEQNKSQIQQYIPLLESNRIE